MRQGRREMPLGGAPGFNLYLYLLGRCFLCVCCVLEQPNSCIYVYVNVCVLCLCLFSPSPRVYFSD